MRTICAYLTDAERDALMADVDDVFGLPRRMARRVAVDLETGCWLAAGSNTGKRRLDGEGGGHAKVSVRGRDCMFHRVAYECLVGPIPGGVGARPQARRRLPPPQLLQPRPPRAGHGAREHPARRRRAALVREEGRMIHDDLRWWLGRIKEDAGFLSFCVLGLVACALVDWLVLR